MENWLEAFMAPGSFPASHLIPLLEMSLVGWKCGSSSRVPALQAWSPWFKPQSHQKKKKESKPGAGGSSLYS
jgi:hypothetical protein